MLRGNEVNYFYLRTKNLNLNLELILTKSVFTGSDGHITYMVCLWHLYELTQSCHLEEKCLILCECSVKAVIKSYILPIRHVTILTMSSTDI